MEDRERTGTGSYRAVSPSAAEIAAGERVSQGSIPMPPPKDPDERERWIVSYLQVAYRNSTVALGALQTIEERLGYSPDPAQGITEGKGLLGQLSKIIQQNERRETEGAAIDREQRARGETRRSVLTGVSLALGVVLAALGIIKAAYELFRH
jgi:hypothetical protein